jgi:exosortase/archaeosortase family protein
VRGEIQRRVKSHRAEANVTAPAERRFWGMPPDLVPVAALGIAFMGYAIWNQAHWWTALEENWFGWLTPAFTAFVLYERRARIVAAWNACGAPGSPHVAGWRRAVLNAVVACGFAFGLIAFLAGSFHRAGAGPSFKGTFLASVGVAAILMFLPWLAAPRSPMPASTGFAGDSRRRLCALLVFPATVWLLSAPLVSVVESRLSLLLLNPMIALVSFVFNILGLPIGRAGNILIMPDGGRVGVEEACSGIRSLTACLFAGSFLGAVYLKSLWEKFALVAAATALALGMNLARTLLLTGWAYRRGTRAIEGAVHDAAGYAVLAFTAAGLFGLLALFNWRARRSRSGRTMTSTGAKDRC